jgi:two-component system nitrate/nitrite sensor histidine kinase NarX
VLAKATSHEHKIDCRFQPNGEVTMSPDKATQLYWIAREAVRNAVTHAQATQIVIGLTRANGHVELIVEDDGTGIPKSEGVRNGIGLLVMTQRAELAGGLLRTERSDSGGTAVRCIISPDT